jgi:hypothetical protein
LILVSIKAFEGWERLRVNKDKRKINFVATAFIIVCAGSYGTTERRTGGHLHEHKND